MVIVEELKVFCSFLEVEYKQEPAISRIIEMY
jgi:hypothetical protein